MTVLTAVPPREPGLWKAALWRLVVLGVVFYSTYGLANYLAEQRALAGSVGSVVFAWERHLPLLAWTIVPYWSINFLYALSVFVCRTRAELIVHWRRLLTVQAIAVTCFLLWPLQFTFDRPAVDGVFGAMFDVLMGFDKPYNQAPSLHIALLVVLWLFYGRHVQSRWGRALLHGWFLLIGLSVLTTWQHHFIDLPTGALLGFFVAWLWPQAPWTEEGASTHALAMHAAPTNAGASHVQRRRLATRYAVGAAVFASLAVAGGLWLTGWAWWLLWPAVALLLVALNYAWRGAGGFQKRADGRHAVASRVLLAPYTWAARLNQRWWLRRHVQASAIGDGVWLGPLPWDDTMQTPDRQPLTAVVDVCAELPFRSANAVTHYRALPWLDLVPPTAAQCVAAADAIEQARVASHGRPAAVLVCCALGYSRSASAVAAWLLRYGGAPSVEDAVARIVQCRPGIVLHLPHREALAQMVTAGPRAPRSQTPLNLAQSANADLA